MHRSVHIVKSLKCLRRLLQIVDVNSLILLIIVKLKTKMNEKSFEVTMK